MDPATARLRVWLAPVAESVDTETVARVGLGAMLVLAGGHKLLAPPVWALYVTDWLAPWLLVEPRTFVAITGWLELLVGGLLLADRYVAPSAAVAAVSLLVTVAYFAIGVVIEGRFGKPLVRAVGVTALALVVLLDALAD